MTCPCPPGYEGECVHPAPTDVVQRACPDCDGDGIALEYVRNTGGHATVDHFVEDHEPIGQQLWSMLLDRGLVMVDERGAIIPTEAGMAELASGPDFYRGGSHGD